MLMIYTYKNTEVLTPYLVHNCIKLSLLHIKIFFYTLRQKEKRQVQRSRTSWLNHHQTWMAARTATCSLSWPTSIPWAGLAQGHHARPLHQHWLHQTLQFHLTLPLKAKIHEILSPPSVISIPTWLAPNMYGKEPDVCGLYFNFTMTKVQRKDLNRRETLLTCEFPYFIRNVFKTMKKIPILNVNPLQNQYISKTIILNLTAIKKLHP